MGRENATEHSRRAWRILIVTVADLPEGGGHTSRLKTLAKCLTQQGHEVRIWSEYVLGQFPAEFLKLSGEADGIPFEVISRSLKAVKGPRSFWVKWRAAFRTTLRFWRERRAIDLLWLNELAFHDMFPLLLLAKLYRIQVVASYEDERSVPLTKNVKTWGWHTLTSLDTWMADHWLTPRIDATVVISRYLEKKYRTLGGRRITLVPTIVDLNRWRCPPKTPAEPLRFLYSGSLPGEYALPEIFEALGQLAAEGHNFEFVCVGYLSRNVASLKRFREMAKRLAIASRVHFTPALPLDALREQLQAADVLLSIRRPSKLAESGLATKLSEYLASGRAVVTSLVGDGRQYVQDGESAWVVPEVTPAAIATVLRSCLQHPEELARIGAGGAAAAEKYFSYHAVGKTLQTLLDQLKGL